MKLDKVFRIWYSSDMRLGARRSPTYVSYVTEVEGVYQNFYRPAGGARAIRFRLDETNYYAHRGTRHGPRGAP